VTMLAALYLPLSDLSDVERATVDDLLDRLRRYQPSNMLKAAYYEGEQRVRHRGISIPPELARLETVVVWAGTAVHVLWERLDWYGSATLAVDELALVVIFRANHLAVEASRVQTDALIFGTAFAAVGTGRDG